MRGLESTTELSNGFRRGRASSNDRGLLHDHGYHVGRCPLVDNEVQSDTQRQAKRSFQEDAGGAQGRMSLFHIR